ncbi:mucin-19-like [Rhipicephalus sanguineus]|uniref:mucin-19-like n=1 Tax=Rhipicephalus sanguineus TaxID=34632 RepID=UPI0018960965|nr:mucin-19-like [Rhipicephalus sanguineus]
MNSKCPWPSDLDAIKFCRPLHTPVWEMRKLRHCVCKRGYVRNSWGDCIPLKMCRRCKCRLQKDWNLCATACPAACDMKISASCSKTCVPGCDCPPGWVLDQDNWKKCIKVKKCQPVCPPHSKFEPCVNSCAPKCGVSASKECKTTCYRGDCVCDTGFSEFVRYERKICVRQEHCGWYLHVKSPFILVGTEFTNGAVRLGGIANSQGNHMLLPGTVGGMPSGPHLLGLSGNSPTGNRSAGAGTRSTVLPGLGSIGVVGGLPPAFAGIAVVESRPSLHPSAAGGNMASHQNIGSAFHPIATLPASGGVGGCTTGSHQLVSTGNIVFGANTGAALPQTVAPSSAIGSAVGRVSTPSPVSSVSVGGGGTVPGRLSSVPAEYRRLILGTNGIHSPVSLVGNNIGIGAITPATLRNYSSGHGAISAVALSPGHAVSEGIRSTNNPASRVPHTAWAGTSFPAPASTVSMPSSALRNGIAGAASSSGSGRPESGMRTGLSTVTSQGGTLTTSALTPSPVLFEGISSNVHSAGSILTTSRGATPFSVTISTVNVPQSSAIHNAGGSISSSGGSQVGGTGVSTGPVSTLTNTQPGTHATITLSPGSAGLGGIGTINVSPGSTMPTTDLAASSPILGTASTPQSLVLHSGGASAASRGHSQPAVSGVTTGPWGTLTITQGGTLPPITAINTGGNAIATTLAHLPASTTRNSGGELVSISAGTPSSGNVRGGSNVALSGTFGGAGINAQTGRNTPDAERSGRYSAGINSFAATANGTEIVTGTNALEPRPPSNMAYQGGGVTVLSGLTGNIPGLVNVGTARSTPHTTGQGSTSRGMSEVRKPSHSAAGSGVSRVPSTVPYLPGTVGYNNMLFRRHLQGARSFASTISGSSVLNKFPEFARLYPEGVDLGEIQPELKRQVEVLLKRGTLRDES